MTPSWVDEKRFKRHLNLAVIIPLAGMTLLAGLLLWQVNHLLSLTWWVEHTDRVIAAAHRTEKLLVDAETGLRGYLLTSDESFLKPYRDALPRADSSLNELARLVADNPSQVRRAEGVSGRHEEWRRFAAEVLASTEGGGHTIELVKSGRGKRHMDAIRIELVAFVETEERLRDVRVRASRRGVKMAAWTVGGMVFTLGGLLALFTRRQLVHVSGAYGQTLGELRQQTEALRESEEKLRQSQKLEAVGRLAGGIAHDFNNLLTVIVGYSELLLMHPKLEAPMRSRVEEIKEAADRASTLTSQLLAFSRKQVLQPVLLDLNETVSGMDRLLRRLIGEDLSLLTVLDRDLGKVKADPGQIEQVIMNLAVNARDAMPAGGKLTIETKNVSLDDAYARQHVAVTPGPYVMLAVSDTGVGMDAETQSHIFEPFFTTKAPGKGTGLGLSTVYGIVKQSGGNIWLYSEPGHGTTFKIYLPVAGEEAGAAEAHDARAERVPGTETILLVEDEEAVRLLLLDILEMEGYTVLAAKDGHEALEVCGRHGGLIDLLLTDVVMPGMSGRQLAERLAEKCRDVKVLYMSGYTDNAIVHHGVLDPGVSFLQKPFTPDAVLSKVREVIDAGQE